MDYMDDEKTTVNIKAVGVSAWDIAKRAANRQNNQMGEWVSRACLTLANLEAGPREFPPMSRVNQITETANLPDYGQLHEKLMPVNHSPKTANPVNLDADVLVSLMEGMAALASATGVMPSKANIRRAYNVVDGLIRAGGGMSPRRISSGPRISLVKLGPKTGNPC